MIQASPNLFVNGVTHESLMILLSLPDPSDDHLLLKRAQRGDAEAITTIYQAYFSPIYQFVYLRVSNPQMAEDITSTVFLKMIDGFQRGRGPRDNLRGWLFRVARNAIYDVYGENPTLPLETIEHTFSDGSSPEGQLLAQVEGERLRAALRQLKPEQQEVVLLRFDQMLSLQETADVLGKNTNTVKTLQFRAIRQLRAIITAQSQEGTTA